MGRVGGAGLLAALVLLGGASALGAYGVSVDVSPPRTAIPGELLTHVFTVTNTGTASDAYVLALTFPPGWAALPVNGALTLGAGEWARVFVTVIIPVGAEAGSYRVTLRATSTNDPTVTAAADGVVDVLPQVGAALEIVRVDRALPGTEAVHVIRIRNLGNVADTYRVSALTSAGWATRVSPAELAVLPGTQREVTVAVLIPRTAAPGSSYRVRVEVTSQTDQAWTQTVWISAVVTPAAPDQVRVDLYPELPITFGLSLTKAGNPRFRLSLAGEVPGVGRISTLRAFDILGVTSQSAAFHTAKWGVDWGQVSITGAFASLSGEGFGFSWYEPECRTTQLILTEIGQGISTSLDWKGGKVRFLAVNHAGPPARAVTEVQFLGSLSETFAATAVLATGWAGGFSYDAYRFRPSMRVGGIAGFLELSEVAVGFPGQTPRSSFGWGLSFGTAADPLWGGFSTATTVSLVSAGPPAVHLTTQEFSASGRVRVGTQAHGSLTFSLETRVADDLPPSVDLEIKQIGITYADYGPVVTWSLSGWQRTTTDQAAAATTSVTGLRVSARAPVGMFVARGTVQVELKDPGGPSSSFTAEFSAPQVAFTPTVGLSVVGSGRAALFGSLNWADTSGWKLTANFELPFAPEGGFSLSAAFTWPISFRLFGPVYGAIRGRAFVDVDSDGRFGPADEPIADLILSAGGQKALTGRDGRFVFAPFAPGSYRVAVEEMPFGVHALVSLPIAVQVSAGQTVDLLIPFESRSMIRGTVYHDLDQSGTRNAGEPGVGGVQVLITNGALQRYVTTDAAGRYAVEVPAGLYTVELVTGRLPERFEPTTAARLQVRVQERSAAVVDFGIWQRPRPVVTGPVVPVARFETPPAIAVGEPATFDGRGSEAPAGREIVSYAWEFRLGQVRITASGDQVTVTFPQAGTWLVTLRVVDSTGAVGQVQRTVLVR